MDAVSTDEYVEPRTPNPAGAGAGRSSQPTEDEVALPEYIRIAWRRRRFILGMTLAAVGAAGAYVIFATPVYEAQALLLLWRPAVRAEVISDPSDPRIRILVVPSADQATPVAAITALAEAPLLQRRLAAEIPASGASTKLTADLRVRAGRDGDFVTFAVRDASPTRSAEIANAWVTLVVEESAPLFVDPQGADRLRLQLIPAVVPEAPVPLRRALTVGLAGIFGCLAGVMLALVTDSFVPRSPVAARSLGSAGAGAGGSPAPPVV